MVVINGPGLNVFVYRHEEDGVAIEQEFYTGLNVTYVNESIALSDPGQHDVVFRRIDYSDYTHVFLYINIVGSGITPITTDQGLGSLSWKDGLYITASVFVLMIAIVISTNMAVKKKDTVK